MKRILFFFALFCCISFQSNAAYVIRKSYVKQSVYSPETNNYICAGGQNENATLSFDFYENNIKVGLLRENIAYTLDLNCRVIKSDENTFCAEGLFGGNDCYLIGNRKEKSLKVIIYNNYYLQYKLLNDEFKIITKFIEINTSKNVTKS